MSKLEIVSVDTTTQLSETIDGMVVNYLHTSKNKELPKVISFQVPSDVRHTNLADGNYVVETGAFNPRINDATRFPFERAGKVFETCKKIADGLK